jgi:hypothetical protein
MEELTALCYHHLRAGWCAVISRLNLVSNRQQEKQCTGSRCEHVRVRYPTGLILQVSGAGTPFDKRGGS